MKKMLMIFGLLFLTAFAFSQENERFDSAEKAKFAAVMIAAEEGKTEVLDNDFLFKNIEKAFKIEIEEQEMIYAPEVRARPNLFSAAKSYLVFKYKAIDGSITIWIFE
jgi:hypothetical protein